MSTLSGLFSRGVGGAEVENFREKKNSLKCCQLFFLVLVFVFCRK